MKRKYIICASLIGVFFLIYLMSIFYLMINQKDFFYQPNTQHPDISQAQIKGIREINYSLPDGRQVFAWYYKGDTKRVVLFFHNNEGNLLTHVLKLQPWIEMGYSVLMPEYQGFSDIKGLLNQLSMEQDGKASMAYLVSKGFNENQIIVYGHGMGAYVASFIARETAQKSTPVKAVVLEAPFSSLSDVLKIKTHSLLPISFMIEREYLYPTQEMIQQVNTPIYIGHGKKDEVIPYEFGKTLYERAPHPKFFFSSDKASHDDLVKNGFIDAVISDLN